MALLHVVGDSKALAEAVARGAPFGLSVCGRALSRGSLVADASMATCPVCRQNAKPSPSSRRPEAPPAPSRVASPTAGRPPAQEIDFSDDPSLLEGFGEDDEPEPAPSPSPSAAPAQEPEPSVPAFSVQMLDLLVEQDFVPPANWRRWLSGDPALPIPEPDRQFLASLSMILQQVGDLRIVSRFAAILESLATPDPDFRRGQHEALTEVDSPPAAPVPVEHGPF